MPPSRSATGRGPITLLAFGHSFVDVYQGAVAALVPFFVAEREYSYAAASAIVLAASLLSSVVQPVFGVLIDTWALRWLLPVSTLIAGLGIALVGVTEDYAVTLAVVAVSGIGVAAYHPPAAQAARAASAGTHSRMGWFSLGGNIGFAAAPLLVAGVIAAGGLSASPWLVLPALAGVLLSFVALRRLPRTAAGRTTPRRAGGNDWNSFLRLTGAIVCRSIVFVGLSAFIALYASERAGGAAWSGTLALFLLYLGGAFGTVVGGHLADRWQRISIVRWSYALTVLAVAGALVVPGPAMYAFVVLASAGLYVPFSLHITLGQDYLPGRPGTASGVTLGLTVSAGGLTTPFIGALADAAGLQAALLPLAVLPAVGWLFLRALREPVGPTPVAVKAGRPGSQQAPS